MRIPRVSKLHSTGLAFASLRTISTARFNSLIFSSHSDFFGGAVTTLMAAEVSRRTPN